MRHLSSIAARNKRVGIKDFLVTAALVVGLSLSWVGLSGASSNAAAADQRTPTTATR